LDCKSNTVPREYISISSGRREKFDNELSRSDVNKLLSFSESPEKYATGTIKAKEKVEYLESIKYKFSEGQLATYISAFKKYEGMVVTKNEHATQKTDCRAILNEAFSSHKSVKIRYKGSWRMIDPYSLNNTYIVGFCHLARDIRTFRVDRVQGAELSDGFNFDGSLQSGAESKLISAPSYKGYAKHRHRY
jgi:hypothetical protein